MNQLKFTVTVIMACANAIEVSSEVSYSGSITAAGITGNYSYNNSFEGVNNSDELKIEEKIETVGNIVLDAPLEAGAKDMEEAIVWVCTYSDDFSLEVVCEIFHWSGP